MREKLIKREEKSIKLDRLTAFKMQDLADFLDGNTVENDKKIHLTGRSLDAVYIDKSNRFVYEIFPYRGSYYSRLDWGNHPKLNYMGQEMMEAGEIVMESAQIGSDEFKIVGWLDPVEIISKVDLWRREAAVQALVPDPYETRPIPDIQKRQVFRWVDKEGITNLEKYNIIPKEIDEKMPLPLRLRKFY